MLYNRSMQRSSARQRGITLIEVIIAISTIGLIVVVVGFSVTTFVDARSQLLNDMKGVYLAEEGYELLRMLRDEDWTTVEALTIGDTYSFAVATTTVAIVSGVEEIDSAFYRSFELAEVRRNGSDDIDLSGAGTVDDEARLVTVSVFGPTGTTSFSGILTNIHAL